MTDYLLDTNHLSPLVTLRHPLHGKVLQQLQAGNTFAIAVPALTEFLYGISVIPRARQNLATWEILKHRFSYYDIKQSDAESAARLQVNLRRQGWQLATVDALIAAITLRYDLTLLTTDQDFRAIVGLKQTNWL